MSMHRYANAGPISHGLAAMSEPPFGDLPFGFDAKANLQRLLDCPTIPTAEELEAATQAIARSAAMSHLGKVLWMFANLAPGDRCRAFESAIAFYNEHNPDARIETEEGFETRIEHHSMLTEKPVTGGGGVGPYSPSNDDLVRMIGNVADQLSEVAAQLVDVRLRLLTVENDNAAITRRMCQLFTHLGIEF